MRHILLLPTLLISVTTCFAQLAPHADATLFEHLREVNREWSDHKDALLEADHRVSFADEAERIAAHLHAVDAYLVRTTPEGLSADQLEHRSAGLLALNTYADQGVFPRNRVLPYRNPIFIDPFGTACAVGQLMIASGASDLAARIDAEMETAYIGEMHWLPSMNGRTPTVSHPRNWPGSNQAMHHRSVDRAGRRNEWITGG
ncbi:MAG: hypothetical protein IPJ10_16430 [Flavobacteriales bacterium]|nr:hypothetical protein [Flavobacteriales bacterium]